MAATWSGGISASRPPNRHRIRPLMPGVSDTIDGAPPGDYTLELWHERLGTQKTTVRITPDEISTVRIDYSQEIE